MVCFRWSGVRANLALTEYTLVMHCTTFIGLDIDLQGRTHDFCTLHSFMVRYGGVTAYA